MVNVAVTQSLPLSVAHGSGTAVATRMLIRGLQSQGMNVAVVAPTRAQTRFYTARQWLFNNRARVPGDTHVVLGIDGDGLPASRRAQLPYIAVLKAVYADILRFESTRDRVFLQRLANREQRAAHAARQVVVASNYSRTAASQHYRLDAANIQVIPEAFGLREWHAQLPAPNRGGRAVLCVAHLYPRKRVGDLLAAWPHVLQRCPDATLKIVGTGPQWRSIVEASRDLPSCTVHGHLSFNDLLQLYASSDVFCLPSAQENFGLVLVEAMASGLPIVATQSGAVPEVTDGAIRTLVEAGQIRELAGAIVDFLVRPEARQAAASINPSIAARYDYQVVGQRYAELFAELGVGGSGERQPRGLAVGEDADHGDG